MSKKIIILVLVSCGLLLAGVWRMARHPAGPGDLEWLALVKENGWAATADLGGYRLYYLEGGQGPPVLLLHGYGDSSYSWHRNFQPLIQAGFRVLALDLPGLGASEVPPDFDFTAESLAREIMAFLDYKALTQVHLIGNSLGGHLSLYLAYHHPDRVGQIVPVCPAAYLDRRRAFRAALIKAPFLAEAIRPFFGPWSVRLFLRECFFDPELVTEAVVSQRSQPLQRPDLAVNLVKLARNYFSTGFIELSRNYKALTTPVLLVWGAHDRVIDTDRFAERLHGDLPGSRLVIIDRAGHVPHEERPEVFNDLVIRFLRDGD